MHRTAATEPNCGVKRDALQHSRCKVIVIEYTAINDRSKVPPLLEYILRSARAHETKITTTHCNAKVVVTNRFNNESSPKTVRPPYTLISFPRRFYTAPANVVEPTGKFYANPI